MPNDKVYIHEFIDIIGHNRANYMHHMTANWCPIGQRERHQLCYGVWGTVGSTGTWPEVVNIWEEDGLSVWRNPSDTSSVIPRFRIPSCPSGGPGPRDFAGAAWTASSSRLPGRERSRSSATTPSVARSTPMSSCASPQVRRGGSLIGRRRRQGGHGQIRLGAGGCLVDGDGRRGEVILLWAIESWEAWAEFEGARARTRSFHSWNEQVRERSEECDRILLIDAPLCPFRTGRQPQPSDHDSYRLPDVPG